MKALDDVIYTKLTGISNIATLAPGGVHNTVRKQGSSFPVIVFTRVGGLDEHAFGASGGFEWLDYDIKVIATSEKASGTGAILAAIHTALHRVALTPTGVTHMQTLRVRRIPDYVEVDASSTYIHRGMTYRFWIT